MADPSNIYAIDELKFLTQYNIEPVVASESGVEVALSRYYDKGPTSTRWSASSMSMTSTSRR